MQWVELDHDHRQEVTDLWERCGLTRPWNPPGADFDRAVSHPASAVLGYLDGARLAATVMVGDDGHRGWVYYLAVAPEARGKGLGRAAMTAAEHWLHACGARKVELMVRTTSHDVAGFYDAIGYQREDVTVFSRWLEDGPS